jgi:hypothetical protein
MDQDIAKSNVQPKCAGAIRFEGCEAPATELLQLPVSRLFWCRPSIGDLMIHVLLHLITTTTTTTLHHSPPSQWCCLRHFTHRLDGLRGQLSLHVLPCLFYGESCVDTTSSMRKSTFIQKKKKKKKIHSRKPVLSPGPGEVRMLRSPPSTSKCPAFHFTLCASSPARGSRRTAVRLGSTSYFTSSSTANATLVHHEDSR